MSFNKWRENHIWAALIFLVTALAPHLGIGSLGMAQVIQPSSTVLPIVTGYSNLEGKQYHPDTSLLLLTPTEQQEVVKLTQNKRNLRFPRSVSVELLTGRHPFSDSIIGGTANLILSLNAEGIDLFLNNHQDRSQYSEPFLLIYFYQREFISSPMRSYIPEAQDSEMGLCIPSRSSFQPECIRVTLLGEQRESYLPMLPSIHRRIARLASGKTGTLYFHRCTARTDIDAFQYAITVRTGSTLDVLGMGCLIPTDIPIAWQLQHVKGCLLRALAISVNVKVKSISEDPSAIQWVWSEYELTLLNR